MLKGAPGAKSGMVNLVGQVFRFDRCKAKRASEESNVIDRAKGILMNVRGIDKEEAYAFFTQVH